MCGRAEGEDVLIGVAPRERPCRCASTVPDLPAVAELRDESCHLLAGKSGDLAQIADDQPFVRLAEPQVIKAGERLGDQAVGVGAVISCEVETHDAVKKRLYLLQCLESLGL